MTVEQYWDKYKEATGDKAKKYSAWHFCDNEKDAQELVRLVLDGKKKATASCLWSFEYDGDKPPRPGDVSIVTDFAGNPKCVIKTVRVDITAFRDVGAEFAACEGEGDSSLEYWREAHTRVFTRECARIGRRFSKDMPVVCERFEVLYAGT